MIWAKLQGRLNRKQLSLTMMCENVIEEQNLEYKKKKCVSAGSQTNRR
jgi:hypothetical protein